VTLAPVRRGEGRGEGSSLGTGGRGGVCDAASHKDFAAVRAPVIKIWDVTRSLPLLVACGLALLVLGHACGSDVRYMRLGDAGPAGTGGDDGVGGDGVGGNGSGGNGLGGAIVGTGGRGTGGAAGTGGGGRGTGGRGTGGAAGTGSGGRATGGAAGIGGSGSGGRGGGGAGVGGAATGGAATGGRGTGGAATGGAATGGAATGGAATGGAATGGAATGGAATGGAATGGAGTGGMQPTIISIDFVGGPGAATGGVGGVVPPAPMTPAETAGVRPATNWNSAATLSASLMGLITASGTATAARVTWTTTVTGANPGVYAVGWVDMPGDTRMMRGYLDPTDTGMATIAVSSLPAPFVTAGYDVYVYVVGSMDSFGMRAYRYSIGATTLTVTQAAPTPTSFTGYVEAPAAGGPGNYVVFRNVTGASFTLNALPSMTGTRRAPVNGMQIVSPPGS
jgi:hypothetical protein